MTEFEQLASEAAQRLWDRLNQRRADNGGTIQKSEWLAITAGQFRAELSSPRPRRKRITNGRNPLFDALAEGCGLNLAELTRPAARAVAVALADVLAVSPDLTTDEIAERIAKYRQKHPSWVLSPPAIAKNWATLGPGERTRTADIYQEPPHWRGACIAIWGEDVGLQIHERGWPAICVAHGPAILRELKKTA